MFAPAEISTQTGFVSVDEDSVAKSSSNLIVATESDTETEADEDSQLDDPFVSKSLWRCFLTHASSRICVKGQLLCAMHRLRSNLCI